MRRLKVLAVGDPAVYAYTHPKYSIIDTFNQKHGVQVDFHIVPWEDYYSSLMNALEKTYDYDVFMVPGHLWLKDFVTKEYLAEVNWPEGKWYDAEDILEVIAKEMELDGKKYLYPSFCDGHILVYRKSIVEGLLGKQLPPVVDTDTIISLAKSCDGINGMKGIAMKAHPSEIFLDFLPYLRNEGVDAFDEKDHHPTFNNEKALLALTNYISLKKYAPENTATFGNDEVREYFQQKKVAFTVTWGGQLGVLLDERCQDVDDVGFSAIKTSWNVTWSFGIHKKSSNQEIANEFLAYLSSKKVDRIIGGYAGSPVRKSTYVTDQEKYNWYEIHLQLIENYAKPLPMLNDSGKMLGPLYEYIYLAFIGKQDPDTALELAEQKIFQIINENK